MKYLEFAVSLIPLLYLLFKEYLSAEARSKEEGIKFQLTRDNLKKLTDEAFRQWIDRSTKESVDMAESWDVADKAFEKKENLKDE